MPCYRPLSAFHSYNEDGTRSILFGRDAIKADGKYVDLPCGQCIGCRLERSRRWAVRIMHEASLHEQNSFITLTYSPENVPLNGSLKLKDFQDFMKRLRRGSSGPLRFFHCGEYGDTTQRPHYHACIFGEDFIADRKLYKTSAHGHALWTSEFLTKTWGLGHAIIGDLTFESAAYVARYCLKKVNNEKTYTDKNGKVWPSKYDHYGSEPSVEGDDSAVPRRLLRQPEYVTMSRRPGIGAGWYERFCAEVYPSDSVVMRGREMLPPPFYDKILERSDPDLYQAIKRERAESVIAFAESEDSSSRRLMDREKVKIETVKNTLRRSGQ